MITHRKLPNEKLQDLYFSPTTVTVINVTKMWTGTQHTREKKHSSLTQWLKILILSDNTVGRDAEGRIILKNT
jgi:hypothetical protein